MSGVWRSAIVAALLLTVPAWPAQAAGATDLDGTYRSKGLNPDGTEYEGVVRITRRGDSFVVSWMSPYATGRMTLLVPTSVGVGVLSGGMLAVSYYSRQTAGVVLYRVEEDGQRLAGSWTVAGDNGAVYAETLTKVSDSDALSTMPPPPTPPADEPQRRRPAHRPLPPGDRSI